MAEQTNLEQSTPSEPPPPYTASSSAQPGASTSSTTNTSSNFLQVPSSTKPVKERNGIPPAQRRSMEDEMRPLPEHWVRQLDNETHHQYFVDTSAKPPRSIWHHPYDDETYLSTLSAEERAKIQSLHPKSAHDDLLAESSADEDFDAPPGPPPKFEEGKTPEIQKGEPVTGLQKFGRRMKDKLTNTTHDERVKARAEREAEEQEAYRQHLMVRRAMAKAAETGQPQLLGKDKDGKDVYVEPPAWGYGPGYGMGGGLGRGYPGQYDGYGAGGYGYSPYAQGPYANPDARYIRPVDPYSRPYGPGYGGGLGLPLLGGLAGGLLLGDLLF